MYNPNVMYPAERPQTASQQKPFYFGGSWTPSLLGPQAFKIGVKPHEVKPNEVKGDGFEHHSILGHHSIKQFAKKYKIKLTHNKKKIPESELMEKIEQYEREHNIKGGLYQ